MRRLFRWIGVLAVVLLVVAAAGAAVPRYGFAFLGPHTVQRSKATLDKPLEDALERALSGTRIGNVEEAMDFALAVSDKLLRFGLDHPSSLAFGAAEREANCVEYSHLFARVFDKAAQKGKLEARAFAVHSEKAEVFGKAVPMRGFGDHDWVLIQDGTGPEARRWMVDPTLHDAWLGWDVAANVHGPVTADAVLAPRPPAERPPRAPQAAKKSTKPPR